MIYLWTFLLTLVGMISYLLGLILYGEFGYFKKTMDEKFGDYRIGVICFWAIIGTVAMISQALTPQVFLPHYHVLVGFAGIHFLQR